MGIHKKFQTEVQKIKNTSESMGSRSDQCESTISDFEARVVVSDQFTRDILKTTSKHEK